MKIGLGIGIPFIRNYISSLFDPSKLFTGSTNGVWYDPSDTATLYRDAAGTLPVTAVEQPVGLMLDKSKNGVGTNGAKRVNLLTKTEDFTGWALSNSTSTTNTITSDGTAAVHGVYQTISATNSTYVFSAEAKPNGTNFVTLACNTGSIQQYCSATFDVSAGVGQMTKSAVGSGAGAIVSTSCVASSDGYYKCTMVFTLTAVNANIYLATNATPTLDDYGRQIFTQSGLSAYVRKADLRLASEAATLPTYQKITDTWYNTLPGNHAFNSSGNSANFPVLSARYNLLTKTEDFGDAVWVKLKNGTGSLPVVTANATTAPNGTLTADRVVFNAGDAYSLLVSPAVTSTNNSVFKLYVKSATGLAQQLVLYWYSGASDTGNNKTLIDVPASGWALVQLPINYAGTDTIKIGTRVDFYPGIVSADVYIWGADLRVSNDALNQPAYQCVNTSTDYDTVGFKPAEVFDGVDDNLIASAGGGSTTAFFWCSAIRVGKVGAVQTLFSDAGTNTGYRVRINASNQLELSAGNGTAYTTVATTATLSIGQRAVLTAWHDGTNLNVQINNGTVHQAAFVTATAGTAQFTIGKDNNAASNFFAGRLYEKVYTKDNVPSAAQITSTKTYVANIAGITLS